MESPEPVNKLDPLKSGIHDKIVNVAYDFYGRRLATCSINQAIKTYDLVDSQWVLNDNWKAHEAAVTQVSWAGPQHPSILASSSYDCTVRIWEETTSKPRNSAKRWLRRCTITDFGGPVYDLQFCPQSTALKLASIASDGVLRIYELLDPGNLSSWSSIWEEHLLNRPVSPQLQSSFTLCWSPSPLFKEWLAVGALDDVFVLKYNEDKKQYVTVCDLPDHKALIRDISWAPSLGRSSGLIATACKDGYVRIYSIKPGEDDDDVPEVNMILESNEHNSEVWRVAWNPSGTVLASTGDRGEVKYWKSMFRGTFKSTACIDELHQLK